MRNRLLIIILFFIIGLKGQAQVIHNTSIEIVGSPTWVNTVNLESKGFVLILKEDQTKIRVVRYDVNLQKLWEQNLFLDTERQPSSINIHGNNLALTFSETSGMYYQIIDFDLTDGEYITHGFEVRDFFQDKELLMFDDKAIMVGVNEKGIAYFVVDLAKGKGKIVETELSGTFSIEKVTFADSGEVRVLATERFLGYKNEKKKKGEYTKSTQIVSAVMDTLGVVKTKKVVGQWEDKFPISATVGNDARLISGIYQDPNGNQGFYVATLTEETNKPIFSMGFTNMNTSLLAGKKKKNAPETKFYVSNPKIYDGDINVGGVFYEPQYQTLRTNTGVNSNTGQRQADYQTVLAGINFTQGYVFTLDENGSVIKQNEVRVNQLGRDLSVPFVFNNLGAVAYISNAVLMVINPNIGSQPIQYRLSDDQGGNQVAAYNRVTHWYDNVFLAIGSQDKVEAYQMEQDQKAKPSKKKNTRPFIQTRRTYFITAVSSGRSN